MVASWDKMLAQLLLKQMSKGARVAVRTRAKKTMGFSPLIILLAPPLFIQKATLKLAEQRETSEKLLAAENN